MPDIDTTPAKKPHLLIPIVVACSFFMEQLDSTIITTAILLHIVCSVYRMD